MASRADPPSAAARSHWSWRSIPWIGGVFIAAIAALAAYDIVRSHGVASAETARELDNQARMIAEQTVRSLQAVDLVLRQIADERANGALGKAQHGDLHAYLRQRAAGLVQIEGLALFDAQGRLLANSLTAESPTPALDVADDPLFARLRDDAADNGLRVEGARRGLLTGQQIFPIVRRLRAADGRFAGVIVAGGRVEHYQDFYRDVRLDAGSAITLLHRNGTLVARFPALDGAIGQRFPVIDAMLELRQNDPQGPLRSVSPLDGVDRFGALAMVAGQPLAVVVTRDARAALAPWRQQTIGTIARTLALGALAALLLAMLQRQFARLDRTRQSLEVSRERFALAAAGSDEGIWDWDVAGDRVYVSARAREIFGAPPGPDVQPRATWYAGLKLHPDDQAAHTDAMQRHMAGQTPVYAGEYRVQHADGSWRWVRVHGLCVRDANGAPLRMAGSVADIDARRRAEDALRTSEERFALAMTGLIGGHWVWETATDALFVSGSVNELFGLPADTQVATRSEYFQRVAVHPDDIAGLAKINKEVATGSLGRFDYEFRIMLPGGELRWILTRARCFTDEQGRVERVAGVSVDISQQKRMEAALRESEERYAFAMSGSNEGHWVWDLLARQIYVSPKMAELFGLPGGAQVMRDEEYFARLPLHPEDRERVQRSREEHIAGKTPRLDHEYRIVLPESGEVRWMQTRAQVFRDADGRPTRLAGSTVDITQRKRAEEALRTSEQRFALAVAGSDDGVWEFDYVNDRVYASRRGREILGVSLEPEVQTLEQWYAELQLHPDDAVLRTAAMQAHLDGKVPAYEGEWRVRQPDGRYRWVRVRGVCKRDAAGKAVRMAGSVSDIDARKRTEDSLRRSEERYALAVAGSDDGVWDWDLVAGVAFESARAREIQGLLPGPEVQPIDELVASLRVHPQDAARRAEGIRAHLAGETPAYECEYRVRGDDGQYRWIRVRALCLRDASGKPYRLAGSVSDVDAQKRAEEALRRSEERYQLAVAGSNEGLWDWDLASDMLFLSPRAQRLTFLEPGEPLRPRDEWIGATTYHPDDVPRVRQAIVEHLRGATPYFAVEYRLQHHTGQWHWYRQRGVAVRDEAGRPTRMAGSMEDITDRKNAEAARERLETQLRQAQKLEAIGTLAGGIAHDFNNILAAILGYGEMAQKDAPEGSAQRRHIDAALSAGMRAKSLVERILAFSRSGMGERVPVHVQSVVMEALEQLQASLPAGIKLERRLDGGDAAVLGDPTQVHQVVMNLCANAVQAMKSRGTLTVTLDRVQLSAPRCATSVLADGAYVRLSVRDTGVGIAAQVLERIFDPFFTTKEVGVGTGLGLSLVHGIVADLGGGIDVQSSPGEGATFTVYLPWQSTVAAPAVQDQAVPEGTGETVLLVDDEEALVRLGEEMIAGLGYEPIGFTSSAAALEAFRAAPTRFDAVLSDEAMPEMTGSELARAIRQIRGDIPIVLMSGYVTPALAQRAREAGVQDVLAKPLVSGDIARCLAGALQA